ncbi:MAG: hypothetical protein HYY06_33130 [Deltaproteobacteria bacterium]|nr:hypothetical protein [Deltaproteobacteria bacterium]
MRLISRTLVTFWVVIFALAPSCKKDESTGADDALAEEAADAVDVAQTEAALLIASVEEATAGMTPEELAQAAAAAVEDWSPEECVTATTDRDTVTYVFAGCAGPYGLVQVDGTLIVTFTVRPNAVHLEASSTDLTVNGASLTIAADADWSVDGTANTLEVSTTGSATGPRGTSISRQGDYTVGWDESSACMSLDGDWSTTTGGRSWSTTVSGYSRCDDGCPAAGGSISYTGGLSGVTISVQYDGSSQAAWSSSRGQNGTAPLFCEL